MNFQFKNHISGGGAIVINHLFEEFDFHHGESGKNGDKNVATFTILAIDCKVILTAIKWCK